ncbi:unnamed protein product, partial [Brassica oleracea var. botrytis]
MHTIISLSIELRRLNQLQKIQRWTKKRKNRIKKVTSNKGVPIL